VPITRSAQTPVRQLQAACAIVEAVCKHYLETENIPLPNKQTIAPLWTEVAKNLGLSPGQMAVMILNRSCQGCLVSRLEWALCEPTRDRPTGHGNKRTGLSPCMRGWLVHAAHTDDYSPRDVGSSWGEKNNG